MVPQLTTGIPFANISGGYKSSVGVFGCRTRGAGGGRPSGEGTGPTPLTEGEGAERGDAQRTNSNLSGVCHLLEREGGIFFPNHFPTLGGGIM